MKQFSKSVAHQGKAQEIQKEKTILEKEAKEEAKLFIFYLSQNLTNFEDIRTILTTSSHKFKNKYVYNEIINNVDVYNKLLKEYKPQPQPTLPVMKFNIQEIVPHSLDLPDSLK